jgi:pimeloyl-ACP methyl ester carboxylesterase
MGGVMAGKERGPTPTLWRGAGKTAGVAGHSIFYRYAGSGTQALLLLHGFPTGSWDWHRIWPGLSQHFRLLAPDFLGLGFSDKPLAHDYSIMEQADIVEDLLRQLGIFEAHVLAHDYGDTVAQELLARAEDRHGRDAAGLEILSLCFLNGGLFPETHRARPVQRLLLTPLGPLLGRLYGRRAFSRTFRAIFGPDSQPTDEEIANYWELVSDGGGERLLYRLLRYIPERRVHRERWVGAMQKTGIPLRLINGAVDPVSGAHMAARYRELVPRADVTLLEGIGHYPQMEAPDDTLREYLAFVERVAGRNGPV